VARLLPSAAGRLLEREVLTLTGILENPTRPLVAIIGGAKVADKIAVIDRLLELATSSSSAARCASRSSRAGPHVGESRAAGGHRHARRRSSRPPPALAAWSSRSTS